MSYNGSGTFLINSAGQPVVAGTVISETVFNALTADLATGLSTAITKDGQTTPTANLPMGGFKLTGLGAGSAAADSARLGQVQSGAATLISASGTDTVVGTMSPTLTAYAAGQQFSFVAAATNTTAMTLNIDGLGAKAITRAGAVALISGDIVSGQAVAVTYDGTRFQTNNARVPISTGVSGLGTGVATALAAAVTGSGGVALAASPTFTGTLTASVGAFSGALSAASPTFTGTLTAANGAFSGGLSAASPTFTGTLTASVGAFSGALSALGRLGVGTASPSYVIHAYASANSAQTMGIENASSGGSATARFIASTSVSNVYVLLEANNGSGTPCGILSVGSGITELQIQAAQVSLRNASGTEIVTSGTTPAGFNRSGGFCVLAPSAENGISVKQTNSNQYAVTIDVTDITSRLVNFDYAGSSKGSVTTDGSSTFYNTTSDERLKRVVGSVAALDLDRISTPMIEWIDRPGIPAHPAFLAQELYEHAPYAVTPGSDAGPGEDGFEAWQVDASKLIPAMVATMRDQAETIRDQTTRTEALENAVRALMRQADSRETPA